MSMPNPNIEIFRRTLESLRKERQRLDLSFDFLQIHHLLRSTLHLLGVALPFMGITHFRAQAFQRNENFSRQIARALRSYGFCPIVLELWSCAIGDEEMEDLADAIGLNRTINHLDLGYNEFHGVGLHALQRAVHRNRKILRLDIPAIRGNIEDAMMLVMDSGALRYLNLSGVKAKDRRMSALPLPIDECMRSLECLVLLGCNFGDREACLIADVLAVNITLKHLNLSRNRIQTIGATRIAKSLESNTNLAVLLFSGNDIGEEGHRCLSDALTVNKGLKKLDLSRTHMTDEDVEHLAVCLEMNATLVKLDLSANRFGKDGAIAIAQSIPGWRSVRKLEMTRMESSCNHVSPHVQANYLICGHT